jgi:hypothetical protein
LKRLARQVIEERTHSWGIWNTSPPGRIVEGACTGQTNI